MTGGTNQKAGDRANAVHAEKYQQKTLGGEHSRKVNDALRCPTIIDVILAKGIEGETPSEKKARKGELAQGKPWDIGGYSRSGRLL